jgi:hypothetical protein
MLRTISSIVMLVAVAITAEPTITLTIALDSCYASPLGPFNPRALVKW